jgi:hypothetical protein
VTGDRYFPGEILDFLFVPNYEISSYRILLALLFHAACANGFPGMDDWPVHATGKRESGGYAEPRIDVH